MPRGKRKRRSVDSTLVETLSFPIMEYLEHFYPDGHMNSTGQYHATCNKCERPKFYFSPDKAKGCCFKCSGDNEEAEGRFSNLAQLIMFTESITYEAALSKLREYAADFSVDTAILSIDKALSKLTTTVKVDSDTYTDIPIEVDIPYQHLPDAKLVKRFLGSRKRPMTTKILELFPAWCSDAAFLAERLVFEVHTNNSFAWLAYYTGDDPEIANHKKTMNPSGSVLSCMLFGYNYIKHKNEPLLVHEGIFDTMRSLLRGYSAVSSFGTKLSPRQVMLINETDASELVLCYDADKAGMKGMWKIVKKWSRNIDKPMSMMILPFEKDADECSKAEMKKAFHNRRAL